MAWTTQCCCCLLVYEIGLVLVSFVENLLFSIYHVPFSFLISAPCLQADYAVAAVLLLQE